MNRTKARENAFILLFEYKFQPEDIEELLSDFMAEHNTEGQSEYIKKVVLGAAENVDTIDRIISEAATGWEFSRLSAVIVSVLRLSVFEMLYMKDIPNIVALNEAIAIGKKYSGDECAPFLNGILSKIMNTIEAEDNV